MAAKERVNGIELGQYIKRQREFRSLTQTQVGVDSTKGQGQIARLEAGQTATVPLADVVLYARGLGVSETAILRALRHPSVEHNDPLVTMREEEALTIAEAYISYRSPHARQVLRKALQYADAIEEAHKEVKDGR